MDDDRNSDEQRRVLDDLEHGDSATRDKAMMSLKRLAGFAANKVDDESLPFPERLRRWGEAEHAFIDRPDIGRALLAAMEDASPRVRGRAAIELQCVRSPDAERALIEHLRNDPHGQVRMMCVSSLRSRRPMPPLQVFIDALRDPRDEVVYIACMALGESGQVGAEDPLREILDHPSWNVRFYACRSLLQLGAVDARVVAELEALTAAPEAAKHDDLVRRHKDLNARLESGTAPPTCGEVLAKAQRALGNDDYSDV